VDAVAPKPQRAGATYAICFSPAPSARTPPDSMTCTIAISTSACMVFSDESTNADTARPTVMEAMERTTTASRISASGDGRYAP